jgi:hypothetical protein
MLTVALLMPAVPATLLAIGGRDTRQSNAFCQNIIGAIGDTN